MAEQIKIQAYLNGGEKALLDELMEEWRITSVSEAIGRCIYTAHRGIIK